MFRSFRLARFDRSRPPTCKTPPSANWAHNIRRRRIYDTCTIGECSWDRARRTMADDVGGAGRGRCVLRFMVLASAGLARLPGGNSRDSELAMACGDPIGAGIRGGSCAVCGILAGRDVELRRLSPLLNGLSWSASIATCGTRCTWASHLDGLGCGWSSDTPRSL